MDACLPAEAESWRRVQAYPPKAGLGDGDRKSFTFFDPGSCSSGWLIDLTANRDDAGELWEAIVIVEARDGIRGDLFKKTIGDGTYGAPAIGGSLRLWIPFPQITVTVIGKAGSGYTGTVQAQGICMTRAAGRGLGGTQLIGSRTQTLTSGGGSTSYPVPPGAIAYRVGAVNGSTTAIKVSEIANGDDDLGTYALTPGNLVAPMDWYPVPPPSDPSASDNHSAIQLSTAGGAEDWTVSWLFSFEQNASS